MTLRDSGVRVCRALMGIGAVLVAVGVGGLFLGVPILLAAAGLGVAVYLLAAFTRSALEMPGFLDPPTEEEPEDDGSR